MRRDRIKRNHETTNHKDHKHETTKTTKKM